MKKEFLLFLAIFFSFFVKAEDNLFKKGTEFYDSGNYQMAITYFDSLIDAGTVSSEIHYNKGNCYFKLDSLALAIVEYERGLNINPKDLDIVYNLKICNDLIIDDINQLPDLFYKQWFSNLFNILGITGTASILAPINTQDTLTFIDLLFLALSTLVFIMFSIFSKFLNKKLLTAILISYIIYVLFLFLSL